MFGIDKTSIPLTVLVAAALAGCDPGTVVVDGKANGNGNGNCNGKNNCNGNQADSLGTSDTGEPMDSEGDDASTTEGLDMADGGDTGDASDTGDLSDMADGGDTGDTGDTGGDPGLQGCGNGLPYAGEFCYLPIDQYNFSTGQDLAIGDVDGDQHADVVVIGTTIQRVYLGDGLGSLSLLSSTGVSNYPSAMSMGDVDGDGDLDFVRNGNMGWVRVHLNDGTGDFTEYDEYVTFTSPRDVLLADLDLDGDLDLSAIHGNPDRVVVRKNDGTGVFGPLTSYDIETSALALTLNVADIDDDGAPDIVAGTNVDPVIVYNLGNGDFDGIGEQVIELSVNIANLAVDDFDLDGHLDIAASESNNAVLDVVFGEGQRMFDPMIAVIPTALASPRPLISEDFDRDGIPDLVSGNDYSYYNHTGLIGIHRGDGSGAFYDPELFSAKPDATNIAIGDLNEDDVPDIVMVSTGGTSPGLSVLISDP
jgi:hypothetical protein